MADSMKQIEICSLLHAYDLESQSACLRGFSQSEQAQLLCTQVLPAESFSQSVLASTTCPNLELTTDDQVDLCLNINNTLQQTRCLMRIALRYSDQSMCEYMEYDEQFPFANTEAVNTSQTLGFVPAINRCQSYILKITQSASCEEIWEDSQKNLCYARVCKTDDCCNFISDGLIRNQCLVRLAVENRNPELCAKSGSFRCLKGMIEDISKPSVAFCEAYQGYRYEQCIRFFAKYAADPSVCQLLEDDTAQDSCVYRTTVKTVRNADLCNQIHSVHQRRLCRTESGKQYMRPTQTNNIITFVILFIFGVFAIRVHNEEHTLIQDIARIGFVCIVLARLIPIFFGLDPNNSGQLIEIMRVTDQLIWKAARPYIAYNWILFLISDIFAVVCVWAITIATYNIRSQKITSFLLPLIVYYVVVLGLIRLFPS